MCDYDANCPYCVSGETFPYGKKVCDLEAGTVYLFHEQSKPGRCILATKRHVNDLTDLTAEERNNFSRDLIVLSKAIQNVYHPGKVNYGSYYDTGHHVHIHVVPKYPDKDEWGSTFTMNPEKVKLMDLNYDGMIEELRTEIEKIRQISE